MRPWVIAFMLTFATPIARAGGVVDEKDTGKKLYTVKCARCHKLYDPAKYNAENWNTWMEKMRRKARLNDEQYKRLSGYLQSVRADAVRKSDEDEKRERR
jgi:mono/diheme cytochrome c family protein